MSEAWGLDPLFSQGQMPRHYQRQKVKNRGYGKQSGYCIWKADFSITVNSHSISSRLFIIVVRSSFHDFCRHYIISLSSYCRHHQLFISRNGGGVSLTWLTFLLIFEGTIFRHKNQPTDLGDYDHETKETSRNKVDHVQIPKQVVITSLSLYSLRCAVGTWLQMHNVLNVVRTIGIPCCRVVCPMYFNSCCKHL